MNGVDGINQGGEGMSQGGIGSFVGKATGSLTGMNRAATGGPGMNQSASQPTAASPMVPNGVGATANNSTRKPQSFLSFLGGILPVAASFIPGVGGIAAKGIGALLGGIGQQNTQNEAAGAAQASTGAQNSIAGQLASGGPALGGLIQAERAGITSAVDNANVANPGKLMMDLFGGAISNAISGVAQQRNAGLASAADIYKGTGATAAAAAAAGGNAWQPLANWATSMAPKPQTPGVSTGAGASSSATVSGGAPVQDPNGNFNIGTSAFSPFNAGK